MPVRIDYTEGASLDAWQSDWPAIGAADEARATVSSTAARQTNPRR
jgi:hypothetical protein